MRYGGTWRHVSGIPPAVKYLLLANCGVFIASLFFRAQWIGLLGLSPAAFWRGALWQPVTYMFLHGGIFHLLFNMLVLWMFGVALEAAWGARRFLSFYFICGVGAGLLNAAVTPASQIPVVGASGAIYGLLMAFGLLFPDQLIYIWGIFPVRARYFVIGIGIVEFLTAVSASRSGIAHVAHLGGMLFGLLYMKREDLQRAVSAKRAEKKRQRHLRVVWDRDREKRKLQEEIDRLLDKSAENGTDSLTEDERETIRSLSRKLEELENRE